MFIRSALVLLYNLQTGSISIKSSLSQARSACGVGVVCGNIYAIGGCYGQKCLDSVEMCHRGMYNWVGVAYVVFVLQLVFVCRDKL